MGDPTEEKVLTLIPKAAACGAEYFCIDAASYSEGEDWWASVEKWEPSRTRFPFGLQSVTEKIQDVVEAFFQRNGTRVLEKDRYHLDFRHPAVISRMDRIVDKLIHTFGIRYFKFDYNINVPYGTDTYGRSPGDGQLAHNRAYPAWLRALIDRHPLLVIENCSSGGHRLDYAMLSVCALQSTSDQQDPVRYAAVAATIMTAVLPEQSGAWCYPQPHSNDELNAFSVVNSLLGRVHLSGRVDQLNDNQPEIISKGIDVYKDIRQDLRFGTPFWPLGLPKWSDGWISVGPKCSERLCYVSVWRRESTAP
ncbi:melibiase subfamily protein [Talaromyces pinophilus]|uniref:alpha-galactosidase n=1 Tax=Talaromyces pinophilus TaxID=128442 RepID=A0A0B8MYI5_TALPI|nr:melibiase subfamily protein [Talaromyces pinophilus]